MLLLGTWSAAAHAADTPSVNPGPHRFSLGASADVIGPGISRDGNWAEVVVAPGVTAGYAYRLMPWLEVGAQVAYWSPDQMAPSVFIPALSVRAFAPLTRSKRTELGLTARAGLLNEYVTGSNYNKTWHGAAFSAASDVRTWVSPHGALQLSLELTFGSARSQLDDSYSAQHPSYGSLGLCARFVLAP